MQAICGLYYELQDYARQSQRDTATLQTEENTFLERRVCIERCLEAKIKSISIKVGVSSFCSYCPKIQKVRRGSQGYELSLVNVAVEHTGQSFCIFPLSHPVLTDDAIDISSPLQCIRIIMLYDSKFMAQYEIHINFI